MLPLLTWGVPLENQGGYGFGILYVQGHFFGSGLKGEGFLADLRWGGAGGQLNALTLVRWTSSVFPSESLRVSRELCVVLNNFVR